MASVFSKIIKGELPSYKLYEDESVFAMLTLDQIKLGHSLVIPKVEIDYWIDVPEKDYLHLQKVALKLGAAIQKATGCRKVFQAVVGLEVPHFHLHLIPAETPADLNFGKAQRFATEEMKQIQAKILGAL